MRKIVDNNFSYVDVYGDYRDGTPYFTVYTGKGSRVWIPLTAMAPRKSRELAELAILYRVLSSFTRNARIQLHGFKALAKALGTEHKTNKDAWAIAEAALLVGLNGYQFNLLKIDDRVSTAFERAAQNTWLPAMHDEHMHAVKTCMTQKAAIASAEKAKKANAPQAPEAKVVKKAVAKTAKKAVAKAEPTAEVIE